MPRTTPEQRKTINALQQHADLGLAVVNAREHAAEERRRVDAYIGPILARYAFRTDADSRSERKSRRTRNQDTRPRVR